MGTIKCEKCSERVPSHRPFLFCNICLKFQHYKCNYLSRGQASEIINSDEQANQWSCYTCRAEIFPIEYDALQDSNVVNRRVTLNSHINNKIVKNPRLKCTVCTKPIDKTPVTCTWCENICHNNCVKGDLGCLNCCTSIIPGYYSKCHEIIGDINLCHAIFNPFDRDLLINQIHNGHEVNESNEENDIISQLISDQLKNCNYISPSQLPASKPDELKVLSHNIRSIQKKPLLPA